MSTSRMRRLVRERGMWVLPAVSILTGVVLALVALWLDRNIAPAPRLPGLPATPSSARTLAGGVAGASLTATAVVFWIRGTLVSLASSRFTPRLLTGLLSDGWQMGATAVMTGLFGVSATALLGIPAGDAATAPHLTLLAVILWTTAALIVMAGIIDSSVRAIHGDRVVAQAVEFTRTAIDRTVPRRRAAGMLPVPEETHESIPIRAPVRGWITGIDEDTLHGLPWTRIELNCQIGTYVDVGTVLLRACPPDGPIEDLRAAITISQTRHLDDDPNVGLRSLADTAVRGFSSGTRDTPTALAAVAGLSALLSEMMTRDGHPVVERVDDTVLIRRIRLVPDDLVAVALGPLVASVNEAASVAQIIRLLDSARESLSAYDGRLGAIRRHVALLYRQVSDDASAHERDLIDLAVRPWDIDDLDGTAGTIHAPIGGVGRPHRSANSE